MSAPRKVLVSPGHGAGWSTWNDDNVRADFLFDADLIAAIEAGTPLGGEDEAGKPLAAFKDRLAARHGERYLCFLGARNLIVQIVYGGFQVDEYDGFESLRFADDQVWL